MAHKDKKKQPLKEDMGLKGIFKTLVGYLTGEALLEAAHTIEETVDHTTQKVIKASTLYIIFVIGMLFFLIGLSRFLQAYNGWVDGVGFAVIGASLIFIGIIAKSLR